MELKVINTQGQDAGSVVVNEAIFAREYNEVLIHQVIKAFMANARSGTRSQKERSEVSKSTRKPFKQKGTGNARAGMASSPLWRGGGRIFPNRPEENFTQKVNRKMYRAALASILSQLVRDDKLVITENLDVKTPKTKEFVEILKNLSVADTVVLLVVDELTEELYLASRNLQKVLILEAHQVDPYSLLRCSKIVMNRGAVDKLQEQWV
ncbi:MAG: 50S ribosomal protein L4 [Neisseriaceae bacterium]